MIDNELKEKLNCFIRRFKSESDEIKSQIHYQSVLNITNQLVKIVNDNETKNIKKRELIFLTE